MIIIKSLQYHGAINVLFLFLSISLSFFLLLLRHITQSFRLIFIQKGTQSMQQTILALQHLNEPANALSQE